MIISGQLRLVRRSMFVGMFLVLAVALVTSPLWGQSLTTGALSGKITDQTGAVVSGAKVTATSAEKGSVHSTVSGDNGQYLLPLLEPGAYVVTVEKNGFQTAKQMGITVDVAVNHDLPFKLTVGSSAQTIEVTAAPPLIEPDNPNTHLTLTQTQIENTPNPGGDISALASLAPGATMAKGSPSYITGQFNGLPGTSVGYEMDGTDYNDAFLNNNESGPTNLLLGSNAVSEVSVNTNAYSVDLGRFGAANVTFTSKSGGNDLHGNVQYQWNGRVLNSYDYFVKAQPLASGQTIVPKPFDNVNNWAASVGGPIIKNKLFFFFDSEGTRLALPENLTGSVPTPAFETYAAAQMALGGCDTTGAQNLKAGNVAVGASANCEDPQANGNTNYERYLPPETGANANGINELPFMQHIFGLFNGTQATTAVGTYGNLEIVPATTGITGCGLLPNGTVDPTFNPQMPYTTAASASVTANAPNGSNPIPVDLGCANKTILSTSTHSPETLTNFRIDYNLNQANTFWGRFYLDEGVQPSGTSALGNPVLNETSWQPNREGFFDWTHTFTPTLVNDFHPSVTWYGAVFTMGNNGVNDENQVLSLLNGLGSFTSPFTGMGSTSFPQGRNVTQYELIDDLSWTHGSHSFKFGENFRRLLVSDYDVQTGQNPSSGAGDPAEFMYGVASAASESFPILGVQPVHIWSLDLYASDTWQVTRNVTLTYGLRATHNNNINNPFGDFARVADWSSFQHGTALANSPLNQLISTTSTFWSSVPVEQWQPRFSAAYQPAPNTLIKVGWGMFSQVAAASSADSLLGLSPVKPSFSTGTGSSTGGYGSAAGCGLGITQTAQAGILQECYNLLDPGQAFSAVKGAQFANSLFQSSFAAGNPSCNFYSINNNAAPTSCVPVDSASTVFPGGGLLPQLVYQYSVEVQHVFNKTFSINTGYVGNHATHNSYAVDPNGYESVCQYCFAPFPYGGTLPTITNGVVTAAGTSTLTNCVATATCDADPRFSTFSQTEYGGGSRFDSLQTTFTQRLWHNVSYNLNYTWSHCLQTGTPFNLTSGVGDTYRDCSGSATDIRHILNASYSYTLPFHTSDKALGYAVNGWQISGATYFESGSPVFPGGRAPSTTQTSGPTTAAIPIPGQPYYAKGQWLTYTSQAAPNCGAAGNQPCISDITPVDSVQWFNPYAFAGEWDSSTSKCFVPGSPGANPTLFGTESISPGACQYPSNYALALRGPWFNWSDMYFTKSVKLTERVTFRFDAQFYNVFNHFDLSTPGITGAIYTAGKSNGATGTNQAGINSSLIGSGDITSGVSPPTGLLGNGNGGDTNPRMIAFQGKITF